MTKYLYLDTETTFKVADGKKDPSPYIAENRLVSCGYELVEEGQLLDKAYLFFYNKTLEECDVAGNHKKLQKILDDTDILVCHNVKFDLAWLWAANFNYRNPIDDTMLREYVLARGQKTIAINLEESCVRREVSAKKSDLVEGYLRRNIGFDEMPWEIVQEYGEADVTSLRELHEEQLKLFQVPENSGLLPTVDLSNELCIALTKMERDGIYVNTNTLDEIVVDLEKQMNEVNDELDIIVAEVMGSTPINLDSPEQVSNLLFGRKPRDKKHWARVFNVGTEVRGGVRRKKYPRRMTIQEFRNKVRGNSTEIYKTARRTCNQCGGTGITFKKRKDGRPFKRQPKCAMCGGSGSVHSPTSSRAGLGLANYLGTQDAASGGFKSDTEILEKLLQSLAVLHVSQTDNTSGAQSHIPSCAEACVGLLLRRSGLRTYISTYAGGLRSALRDGSLIHPSFNQSITSTARLSCSNPNLQNMPRGRTFPIKRCIQSRFRGGKIVEADYAQLEFRAAVELSRDTTGLRMILEGEDAHAFTALQIFNATADDPKFKDYRQASKPHTFKPLYGGSSGTLNEVRYYKAFLEKHTAIKSWQTELCETAVDKPHIIRLPSGREYCFPYAERTKWGGYSYHTQIKNYPVQGFATADIVPLANIRARRLLEEWGMRSLIINTVHDCIVMDCYPGEEDMCHELLRIAMLEVEEEFMTRWGWEPVVPLAIEIVEGPTWSEVEEIGEFSMPCEPDYVNSKKERLWMH